MSPGTRHESANRVATWGGPRRSSANDRQSDGHRAHGKSNQRQQREIPPPRPPVRERVSDPSRALLPEERLPVGRPPRAPAGNAHANPIALPSAKAATRPVNQRRAESEPRPSTTAPATPPEARAPVPLVPWQENQAPLRCRRRSSRGLGRPARGVRHSHQREQHANGQQGVEEHQGRVGDPEQAAQQRDGAIRPGRPARAAAPGAREGTRREEPREAGAAWATTR